MNYWKLFQFPQHKIDVMNAIIDQWVNSRAYYGKPGDILETRCGSTPWYIHTNIPVQTVRKMANDCGYSLSQPIAVDRNRIEEGFTEVK